MKKVAAFLLLVAGSLLAGCSTGKSDFDCTATSSDTCMTIEQANDKARALSSPKQKAGAVSLPVVVSKTPAIKVSNPVKTVTAPAANPWQTPRAGAALSAGGVTPAAVSAGVRETPWRAAERTAKVWVAPFVDTDDSYHEASTISIVVYKGEWKG